MSDQIESENPVNWASMLFNTAGFIWGFLLGGAAGYFGNWLWHKFGPKNHNAHLKVETDAEGINFSGRLTNDNKEQVLKTLKATTTPTSTTPSYTSKSTNSGTNKNVGNSSTKI
ncbi:hypothetical protein [Shewanella algidipiscicola]|uniref:Uncharacterized protein n=1 Tax=Shewanella algidipiscicola TaxID=614070 RepID=A0ABQ4P853_9GAMM|nr:hypothetical protein [Shewanella algidipiscicola]GIU43720.1 hypothetical protein TUM4630_07730 [Shewanella algidipiscicola]